MEFETKQSLQVWDFVLVKCFHQRFIEMLCRTIQSLYLAFAIHKMRYVSGSFKFLSVPIVS